MAAPAEFREGVDEVSPFRHHGRVPRKRPAEPEYVSVIWPVREGSLEIETTWAQVNYRFECIGVFISTTSRNVPITASQLRQVPLARILDSIRKENYWTGRSGDDDFEPALPDWITRKQREVSINNHPSTGQRRAGRPRKWGPDHFVKVAEIYRRAWQNGDNPTEAVSRELHASYSQAAKWVSAARNTYGLLPPTQRGQVAAAPQPDPPAAPAKRKKGQS